MHIFAIRESHQIGVISHAAREINFIDFGFLAIGLLFKGGTSLIVEMSTINIPTLEERYINCCRRHGVLPNSGILSAFFKAEVKKCSHENCSMDILLDYLKDSDVNPLLDVCLDLDASEIKAVNIRNGPSCVLSGEYALSLIRAIHQKLQIVDLQDLSFGKGFLRDISQRGLGCQILTLRSSHFRKLNLAGDFTSLHTLNLDFSLSLTSFGEECFTCMPNLRSLSMCGTRITNLWTTITSLSKLPALVDLRFQYWLCSNDSGASAMASNGKSDDEKDFIEPIDFLHVGPSSVNAINFSDRNLSAEEALRNLFSIDDMVTNPNVESVIEDSSDDSEVDFSCHSQGYDLSNILPQSSNQLDLQNEICLDKPWNELVEESTGSGCRRQETDVALKYISYHPSPICFEKYYREYMIASLTHLKVLDNLPIRKCETEKANTIFSQSFEYLPYRRKYRQSVVSILQNREIRARRTSLHSGKCRLYPSGSSQYFYSRSLSAAKMGSSIWPSLHPLSFSGNRFGSEIRSLRPRQFEYHPSDPSLMVIGTLDGEVIIVNHEIEQIVSYIPTLGVMNSVLGLCWLKKFPSKLIAGSDNGSLKLYDIQHTSQRISGIHQGVGSVTFDDFDQLTSVHVNSDDELFLASGYSRNVALYDIGSGRCLQVFADMHNEHINVVKFANHSPSIFATSSFDHDVKMWDLRQKPLRPCFTTSSYRGNVMVCFSPDDQYLLVSAVDNEVRQLLAADGRLHLNFEIASTGSSQNYTRSYYMNGRDYIITGSCDEHIVRIYCAQTGRRLRDVSLEGRGLGSSMFVQSLRGDPFRDFNLSVLAAYMRPSSNSEIVKVNLLASSDHGKEGSSRQSSCPFLGVGA